MTEEVVQYLRNNREALLNRLYDFLSIPSISTDSEYKEDVKKGAEFVADYLNEIGFEQVEIIETERHPLVYAEWMKAENAPTALFYGHYDVQPADPYEEWVSEPFQPEVRDGRIYARGSSDDKGQVFMHLSVFEAYMNTVGELPVNIKVCIEGEEEIGSENLTKILKNNKEKFAADFSVISDSGMVESGQPTITYGLKGFTGLEFTLKGPSSDLHSGMYGGAVRNPAMAMAHLLTTLKNEEEVVMVDGFYDGVEELTDEERKLIKEVPGEDFKASTGITDTTPEKGFTAKEHTMTRPTLEINGLYSGYQGEGTKTIIPSTATAKITCRLVPGQDPDRIQDLIVEHLNHHVPNGVTIDITREPLSAKAYKVDPNHPLVQKAGDSLTKAFGKETVYVRMGGSIPVVELLDQLYKKPVVLLGFGTPEDGLHSPNESFPLESFDKGMETIVYYWDSVTK
ncbi:Acetylornithine deacetylase/Succinyl-diaminopimelate desuccinylase [Salinibacillus kushneri]|uniref:Acetylornithine deacetylase/Succinyl-diaminopimelate desuccinylase n=1 Tax=Salinibacillus kushneri TaxID=237682 RepID=A0A1I0DQW6_9BACI|nr:dipeptidase [Salinibacillus kushneri]SET34133.1 Acetylornithine deacetylase/Succinyl-diaminopimelate desuccinylase [Salinibacillus kushneri]